MKIVVHYFTFHTLTENGKSSGILKDFGTWDCVIGDKMVTVDEVSMHLETKELHEIFEEVLLNKILQYFDVN